MAVENEGFASRWSRRKQQVANEAAVEDLPEVVGEVVVDEAILAEQRLEKLNELTDDDMPDVDTLGEGSDFSGFMSSGVSETLRKMALQKLFHGKSYNVRDGLDEYDGDYTKFAKLDPSVITCDMKHMLEVEAKKLLAEKEKAEEEAEADRLQVANADNNDNKNEIDAATGKATEIEHDNEDATTSLNKLSSEVDEKWEVSQTRVAKVASETNVIPKIESTKAVKRNKSNEDVV